MDFYGFLWIIIDYYLYSVEAKEVKALSSVKLDVLGTSSEECDEEFLPCERPRPPPRPPPRPE